MRDETGLCDACEALDAMEVDRRRVQRRVRAASWWFYPAMSVLVAVLVASPGLEVGVLPVAAAVAIAAPLLVLLLRRQTGMSGRIERGLGVVIVIATLLGLAVLGLFLASALAVRFELEALIPLFAVSAGAAMLLGSLLLEVLIERGRRAR